MDGETFFSFSVPSQVRRSLPPFPTFVDGECIQNHNFVLNTTSVFLSDDNRINIKHNTFYNTVWFGVFSFMALNISKCLLDHCNTFTFNSVDVKYVCGYICS